MPAFAYSLSNHEQEWLLQFGREVGLVRPRRLHSRRKSFRYNTPVSKKMTPNQGCPACSTFNTRDEWVLKSDECCKLVHVIYKNVSYYRVLAIPQVNRDSQSSLLIHILCITVGYALGSRVASVMRPINWPQK